MISVKRGPDGCGWRMGKFGRKKIKYINKKKDKIRKKENN